MLYNNKYNKFIDKLDTSEEFKNELIEKLKKQELKKGGFKMKLKSKIVSIISALSIISIGGVAFACVMSEDIRTSLKSFFGIVSIEQYEEAKIDTNEIRTDNGYSLTLENYGFDAETLLLSYNLKTKDEIKLEYPFYEEPNYYFYDIVKIVSENQDEYVITNEIIHGTDAKYTILLDKINSHEYKIYEIYSIDSSKVTENSKLYLNFGIEKLQENADELVYNKLCNFNFDIPINLNKINNNFKEFHINNATATWDSYIVNSEASPNGEVGKATAQITKIKNSDIVTKLTLQLDGFYHTNTEYTLKIVNENNNVLLDRDIEYFVGGVEQDIVVPRLDMNSKIHVIFYEEGYVYNEEIGEWIRTDIASATMALDLAKIAK